MANHAPTPRVHPGMSRAGIEAAYARIAAEGGLEMRWGDVDFLGDEALFTARLSVALAPLARKLGVNRVPQANHRGLLRRTGGVDYRELNAFLNRVFREAHRFAELYEDLLAAVLPARFFPKEFFNNLRQNQKTNGSGAIAVFFIALVNEQALQANECAEAVLREMQVTFNSHAISMDKARALYRELSPTAPTDVVREVQMRLAAAKRGAVAIYHAFTVQSKTIDKVGDVSKLKACKGNLIDARLNETEWEKTQSRQQTARLKIVHDLRNSINMAIEELTNYSEKLALRPEVEAGPSSPVESPVYPGIRPLFHADGSVDAAVVAEFDSSSDESEVTLPSKRGRKQASPTQVVPGAKRRCVTAPSTPIKPPRKVSGSLAPSRRPARSHFYEGHVFADSDGDDEDGPQL